MLLLYSTGEDGTEVSAAGQMETYLGVKGQAGVSALIHAWCTYCLHRVHNYIFQFVKQSMYFYVFFLWNVYQERENLT